MSLGNTDNMFRIAQGKSQNIGQWADYGILANPAITFLASQTCKFGRLPGNWLSPEPSEA
jgi:hypothetical protein